MLVRANPTSFAARSVTQAYPSTARPAGWIKDATGSFTWGLLAAAAGVLLTGIMAVLIGHDAAAEHGDSAAASGLQAPAGKSTNKAAGRAA